MSADLKAALKEGKTLLGSGKNEEALELFKEFVDRGDEDYMLFCFAALANANLEDATEARELFKKALKMDESKPIAWQGLLKLYDAGQIPADDIGLKCCDKVAGLSDSDEKRAQCVSLKRRLLFDLSRFDELRADFGTEESLMIKVINRLAPKQVLSTTENQLLSEAFNNVAATISNNSELHLAFCKYQYKTSGDWQKTVWDYSEKNQLYDVFVQERIVEMLVTEYFINGTFGDVDNIGSILERCTDVDGSLTQILNNISCGELAASLDIMDSLSDNQLLKYPIAVLVIRLLAEEENWERLIKIVDWAVLRKETTPELIECMRGWKLHALIETNDIEEAVRVQKMMKQDGQFLVDKAVLAVLNEEGEKAVDALILLATSSLDVMRLKLIRSWSLDSCQDADTARVADELANSEDATWSDLVLCAETTTITSQLDVTKLLVKAAKLNPRSSRAFFILGTTLLKKNLPKAKSCLERAVKIRPTHENYVRVLDEVLEKMNATAELRLGYLKKLNLSKVKKPWLKERLARLFMITGDKDSAIEVMQQLTRTEPCNGDYWAQLADAYYQRGNLQASVNAFDRVLELKPGSDYSLPLIRVLVRLRNYEAALVRCELYRQERRDKATVAINILEAQVHLGLLETSKREEKLKHIKAVFKLLDSVMKDKPRISLAYKLAGDVLIHASGYTENIRREKIEIPASWSVSSAIDAVRRACSMYSVAVDLNAKSSLAWNDLAVALMICSRLDGQKQMASRAVVCLRKALCLGSSCASTRSILWTKLAEAYRLSGESPAKQQHCLVRALNINKTNDEAWLRIAILYYVHGEPAAAHQALEAALKWNPQLAAAWCGWAMKADMEGQTDVAADMYRHSLSIRPMAMAVCKYTAITCESIRSGRVLFDPATVMIDFDKVLDLGDRELNAEQKLHLGVLADLFGHYAEASGFLTSTGESLETARARAALKNGEAVLGAPVALSALSGLVSKSSEELLDVLMNESQLYGKILTEIQKKDAETAEELQATYSKNIFVPLVVSAMIRFRMDYTEDTIRVLHEVLPRHELIDYYPTEPPPGIDTGLEYLEEDGEEPFRYKHHIAKPLLDVLQKRRAALELKSS